MNRRASTLILAFAACGLACRSTAQGAKLPEFTDPAELQADPDFAIQGEYAGEKIGAQAIAQGDGKFNVAVFEGGLPGDGWKRGDKESAVQGERDGGTAKLTGAGYSGAIAAGRMTLTNDRGTVELKRTVRKSPTLGAMPPAHAIVLFDGKDAEKWQPGKLAQDGYLDSEATTKEKFDSYHLHVEFRLSYMPQARGQSRSNSGVYLHDCYEIQVLDSFGLEGDEQRVRRVLHHPGARSKHVPAPASMADLRRGLHRTEVREGSEDGQRPRHRATQRCRDPRGRRVAQGHAGTTEGRTGPASALSPGSRQPRSFQQRLAGTEIAGSKR